VLPPVPLNHRVCAPDTELGGYRIARGTELISSICHTHRLPELFPEPGASVVLIAAPSAATCARCWRSA